MDGADTNSHWVFGYGSLIWNPGFPFVSSHLAVLGGAHRSLAVYSHHYRGTAEVPGLVFGLVRGGSCRGMAFEVDAGDWDASIDYLRKRELVTDVYLETLRPVRLADGRVVTATTYMVDEHHIQYAGRLPVEEQLRMVRSGVGVSGPNRDYVLNTAERLRELGIRDKLLAELVRQLRADGRSPG